MFSPQECSRSNDFVPFHHSLSLARYLLCNNFFLIAKLSRDDEFIVRVSERYYLNFSSMSKNGEGGRGCGDDFF